MTHNYLIADRSASRKGLPLAWRLPGMPGAQTGLSPLYSFTLVWLCFFAMQAEAQFPRRRFPWSRWPGGQCHAPLEHPHLPGEWRRGRRSDFRLIRKLAALIVIADEKTRQAISQVVSNLDRPKPQVLIKVVFLEVTHNNSSDIGIDGSYSKNIGNSCSIHYRSTTISRYSMFTNITAGSAGSPGHLQRSRLRSSRRA